MGTASTGHRLAGPDPVTPWLHRVPAHHKIAAAFLLVLTAVSTPSGVWWPYAVIGAVLGCALASLRLSPRTVLRRMSIEIPFLGFAALLPFVAEGTRMDVGGLSLSRPGLAAAAGIAAKATIGVLSAIVLAASTPPPEIIDGLRRLRLPATMVAIAGFMVRYLDVIVDDVRRMRVARESRGFPSSRLGHLRAVAAGAGTLFIRSYERGERVHLAMLARGYSGTMPQTGPSAPAAAAPIAPLYLAVAVVAACVALGWVLR